LKKSTDTHPLSLDQIAVTQIKGVGSVLAVKLAKLGLNSIQDILFHLPLRYLDRTRVTPVAALQPGTNVVIEGEVRASDVVFGKRRSLLCKMQDATGTVSLRFYHFNKTQQISFSAGRPIRVFGEVRRGSSGLEFYHPEYEFLDEQKTHELQENLTPIYPATEGLTQTRMRMLAGQALHWLNQNPLREFIPEELRTKNQSGLAEAIKFLHQPPAIAYSSLLEEGQHPYQQALAFEELLAHHLSLLLLRKELQSDMAPGFLPNKILQENFLTQLAFKPTSAQLRVFSEIAQDMEKNYPMLRLVQGDVGSGKTLVAAMSALVAIANGYQVAIMAPTEILAEQHKNNFSRWMQPLSINVGWLTGRLGAKEKREQLAAIADGHAKIIVGTHALFQDSVNFAKLGLIIIDEQHRFGVQQRLSLRNKANHDHTRPHQLIMTATPIPRTLAMSAYADLDISVIDELPPGRTPVTTVTISDARRDEVIQRVHHACTEGKQVYWVCTLIEESEQLEAQAAEVTATQLANVLQSVRIGLIHGRLKPAEKDAVMNAFKSGEIQLLVATTVIEVGVDVPNASLMIIENPERLGIAQLHQLRGRVGRGSIASHCVLLYASPLSQHSKARLQVMRESSDGFYIAEQDLLLRGPGEVLGTRQTGEMQFKIADLQRDADLLDAVRKTANQLLNQYPENCQPLIHRWLGENYRYWHA
jgi:ATP-dependent DNA helicase RecG